MSDDRLVSVIIPSHERFELVERAIASVIAQRHVECEILVVDDASTDSRYRSLLTDARVRYLRLATNSGSPVAPRNLGMAMARGAFLAFLDDDDQFAPDKLERQLARMAETRLPMSCTEACYQDAAGQRSAYHLGHHVQVPLALFGVAALPPIYTRAIIASHNLIIASSVVLTRELAHRVGPFRDVGGPGEDWAYWLRCLALTDCAALSDPLVVIDDNSEERVRWWR